MTISFGARNLADLPKGLAEMHRVLKPGGRLAILEITQPSRQPLAAFFGLWFDRIVPMLGKVAGDSSAYTYLPESVRSFPDAKTLAGALDAAGFKRDDGPALDAHQVVMVLGLADGVAVTAVAGVDAV